jgi:hypothetical protein
MLQLFTSFSNRENHFPVFHFVFKDVSLMPFLFLALGKVGDFYMLFRNGVQRCSHC